MAAQAQKNKTFLDKVSEESRQMILGAIAVYYGISIKAAYAEVTAPEAEHLLDYMIVPERTATRALMQKHGMYIN